MNLDFVIYILSEICFLSSILFSGEVVVAGAAFKIFIMLVFMLCVSYLLRKISQDSLEIFAFFLSFTLSKKLYGHDFVT